MNNEMLIKEMTGEVENCGYEYLADVIKSYQSLPYPINECPTEEDYLYWSTIYDFIWDNATLIMTEGTASDRQWIMNEAADCDKEWNGEEFIQN